MRRILAAGFTAAMAACGSVNEHPGCSASTDCPVGEYCAHADGERFCWKDGAAPEVSAATASCAPPPCVRDGVLRVEATVTDDEEVLGASVMLDLGGPPVAMTRGEGDTWTADVPLRQFPFETFERDVVATVTAQDGARNASQPLEAAAVRVTRLRWERTVDSVPALDLSPPAVMTSGTVVLGGSAAKLYFIAPDGSDAVASLAVGSGRISAAPAIGERAIWVGSEDFNLYGVKLDGTGVHSSVSVNTGGAVRGSVAIRSDAMKEWAFGASSAGFVGVTSSQPNEYSVAGPANAITTGPVLGLDGRAHVATATGTLRTYRLTTAPAVSLSEAWSAPPSVGSSVSAPAAVDGAGNVWTVSVDRLLYRTAPGETSGTATQVATLDGAALGSPVILASGDVVVGDQGGVLHRFSSSGTEIWLPAPSLGASAGVLSPLALAGGSAAFVVPTTVGSIHAVREDGSVAWSHSLAAGVELRPGNIHTPPGQTEAVTSTAYFSAANGKLYAVVVDGRLDDTAPWPKAFHDPRNTNRAGPQP